MANWHDVLERYGRSVLESAADLRFIGLVDYMLAPYLAFMLIAMLWTATGPHISRWRTAYRRRKAVSDEAAEPIKAATQLIIVPIHGTFAFGAAWTRRGHRLIDSACAAAGTEVVVRRFLWSGGNTFRARSVAAIELRRHLSDLREEANAVGADPKIVLIAHSHGGNVAVDAAEGAASCERPQIDHIVCLATPFLRLEPRHVSEGVFIALGLVPTFVALNVLLRLLPSAATISGWQYAAAALVPLLVGMLYIGYSLRITGEIVAATRWRPGATERLAGRLTILRTEADEASGALGMLAATIGLTRLFNKLPMRVVHRFEELGRDDSTASVWFLRLAVLAAMAIVVDVYHSLPSEATPMLIAARSGLLLLAFWLFTLLIAATTPTSSVAREVFDGLLSIPISVLLPVITLGFGNELVFAAPYVSISAEPSPPGRFVIHQFAASGDFAHSDAYQNPDAISLVAAEIASLRS